MSYSIKETLRRKRIAETPLVIVGQATDKSLCMPFPLRPNFMAQVIIPRDMTKAEADRLCNLIMTLANSEDCDHG